MGPPSVADSARTDPGRQHRPSGVRPETVRKPLPGPPRRNSRCSARLGPLVQVAIQWSDTYINRCMHVRTGTISNCLSDVRHRAAYHAA